MSHTIILINTMTFISVKDFVSVLDWKRRAMSPMKSRSSSPDMNEDSVKRDQRSSSVTDEYKSEIRRTVVSRSRSISRSVSRTRRSFSRERRDRSRSRSRSWRRSRSRSRGRRSYRSSSRSGRRSNSEDGYRLHIGGNWHYFLFIASFSHFPSNQNLIY